MFNYLVQHPWKRKAHVLSKRKTRPCMVGGVNANVKGKDAEDQTRVDGVNARGSVSPYLLVI